MRGLLAKLFPGVKVRAKCGSFVYMTGNKSLFPSLRLGAMASWYEKAYACWVLWKHRGGK